MQGINLDFSGLNKFVSKEELEQMTEQIKEAHELLKNRNGVGGEMLGWLDLPQNRDEEEIQKIKECADKIQRQSEVFVVIGIGGSYLGARAMIDIFTNTFNNLLAESDRKSPQILFAGNNMSPKYLRNLIEYLEDKDFSINVISKSGKTLEPAITFRMLRILLEEKYGIAAASERIFVTTDKEKGTLHDIAVENDYTKLVIPNNVGGRYSVLTAVGLLPMAVANIDIEDLLDGAGLAAHLYSEEKLEFNDCYQYAAYRNLLHQKGKDIEILASYEPSFQYFIEWYKQLFGESEGKNGKGIFPAGALFTTDLHSMGQMIQEGKRNLFETVIQIKLDRNFIQLPETEKNEDGLNYLAGKEMDYINKQAYEGTVIAHVDGNVPNIVIELEEINEYTIGQLIFFFEKACAMSAYLLGVNPFNQPGVEEYKKNMMSLLGN